MGLILPLIWVPGNAAAGTAITLPTYGRGGPNIKVKRLLGVYTATLTTGTPDYFTTVTLAVLRTKYAEASDPGANKAALMLNGTQIVLGNAVTTSTLLVATVELEETPLGAFDAVQA